LLKERFDLIDALVDRVYPHTALQGGTPFLAQVAQTLAQPTAKEHPLIQIQPKASVFLQDRIVTDHIVPTPLTLHHRHLQSFDLSPSGLERTTIMPISREVVGILTPTMTALPIDLADVSTHPPWTAWPPTQFGRHFGFTKLREQRSDRFNGGFF
jgi:hypothetical protein